MASDRNNKNKSWQIKPEKPQGFARLDEANFPEFEPGTVWLVGAGPGAPGLLTLMGYYSLQNADVIIYDALVNSDILDWARSEAEIEFAGKRGGKPSSNQNDITIRLIELAKAGKRVLRLKGGDPFMFGRGGEECQQLAKNGIAFRIVPGISAGTAGLAYAGIPATHRDTNHSIIFLTGHDSSGHMPESVNWQSVATTSPVIVMFMAVRNLTTIAEKLLSFGRSPSEPVAIVSNATLPQQSIHEVELGNVKEDPEIQDLPTPAIVVVGKVVDFRTTLDWYSSLLRENRLA